MPFGRTEQPAGLWRGCARGHGFASRRTKRAAIALKILSAPHKGDTLSVISECLLPLCGPQFAGMFALVALELIGHPEQCAKDGGAIIAGQVHDTSFDNEAAQFDQMPRALAALDLPCAHVMPRPCRLMPVARGSVAPQRR